VAAQSAAAEFAMTPIALDPSATALDLDATLKKIAALKARLGDRLLILGHHYQRSTTSSASPIAPATP
jgi:hypothetical protein